VVGPLSEHTDPFMDRCGNLQLDYPGGPLSFAQFDEPCVCPRASAMMASQCKLAQEGTQREDTTSISCRLVHGDGGGRRF
jgi:hypothetical protein